MTSIFFAFLLLTNNFLFPLFSLFSLFVNLIIFLKAFIHLTIHQLEVSGNCFIFFSNLKNPLDNKKEIRLDRK